MSRGGIKPAVLTAALAALLLLGAAGEAHGQARGREEGRQSGGGKSESSSSSSSGSSSEPARSREERNQQSGAGGGTWGPSGGGWHPRRHPVYRYGTVYDSGYWRELAPETPQTRIVFAANREKGDWELFSMNPEGRGLRRITRRPGEERHPALSPDGHWLVFAGRSPDGPLALGGGAAETLWICDATNGQGLRTLTPERPGGTDHSPRFSPDGTRVVFVSDRDGNPELYSLDVPGGANVLRLTNDSAHDADPAFSPDGGRLVFASDRGGATYRRLFVMNSLGGSGAPAALRFVDGEGREETFEGGDLSGPAFSPDGTRLAFVYRGDVYSANADGTDLRRLTRSWGECSRPTWSPDGNGIAFTARREGRFGVYLMGAAVGESGGISRLSDARTDAGSTDWR